MQAVLHKAELSCRMHCASPSPVARIPWRHQEHDGKQTGRQAQSQYTVPHGSSKLDGDCLKHKTGPDQAPKSISKILTST